MLSRLKQQKRRSFPHTGRKRSILDHRGRRPYLVLAGVLTLGLVATHQMLGTDTKTLKSPDSQAAQVSGQTSPAASLPAAIPRESVAEGIQPKPEPPLASTTSPREPPQELYVPPYARLAPKPLASSPAPETANTTSVTSTDASSVVPAAVPPQGVAANDGSSVSDDVAKAVQVARNAAEASRRILETLKEDVTKNDTPAPSVAQSIDSGGAGKAFPAAPTPAPLAVVSAVTNEAKAAPVVIARIPTPAPKRFVEEEKSVIALPLVKKVADLLAAVAPPLPRPLLMTTVTAASLPARGGVPVAAPMTVAMPAPLRIAATTTLLAQRDKVQTQGAPTPAAGPDHGRSENKGATIVSQAGKRVFELVRRLKSGTTPPHAETTTAAAPAPQTVATVASRAEPEVVAVALPQPMEKPAEKSAEKGKDPGAQAAPGPVAANQNAAPAPTETSTPHNKANHALLAQMQHTFKSAHRTVKDFVRDGDHLAAILGRNEVDQATTREVADAARPVYDLAHHLQPGKGFRLAFGSDGELTALSYPVSDEETFLLTRDDNNQFVPKMVERKLEHRLRSVSSIVNGSLFVAARKVGLSQQMGIKLANLFEWDVDFARDIRAGDRFTVLYEEYLENGRPVRDGEILAAEFINQGHAYRVIRYTDPSGRTGYFDPDGQNVQKMFIRAPVDFSRITSQFSMKRKHPIFGFTRAHKGVDYGAPVGTLVRAAGDGVVMSLGRKSSYGNLVVIRHNTKYSTGYAHLAGFVSGLHVGSRVRQGQVIGQVGMTGVTTGPHLHYEVRLNGEAINPLSIQSPAANPVASRHMADFRNRSKQLVALLDRSETMIAALPVDARR
ncbi:MAG: peptidoglycan DD-metalloendopeptidase family protein [Magnetococcales bacterium]|nr:peptidoglycan DD-metalloendopeptidase family protein [Magnetococcales bacterium]